MAQRFAAACIAAVTIFAAAAPAFADATVAEALYRDGKKLFEEGKFNEACDKFGESERQDSQIGTAKAHALACEKANRFATSWAAWNHLVFIAKSAGDADLAASAQGKAAAIEPNLSKLTVNVAAPAEGLLIRRDGQDIGTGGLGTAIPVDGGAHVIEATAPGYEVWQTTVTMGPTRDIKIVTIPALTKKTEVVADGGAPPNKTKRLVSYIIGGAGVASLGVGAAMGIIAISDKSSATSDKSLCGNNDKCTTAGKAKIDSATTAATVSDITLGVGVAAVGTAAFLFFTSRGSGAASDAAPPAAAPAAARLVPTFGPQGGGLSITGAF